MFGRGGVSRGWVFGKCSWGKVFIGKCREGVIQGEVPWIHLKQLFLIVDYWLHKKICINSLYFVTKRTVHYWEVARVMALKDSLIGLCNWRTIITKQWILHFSYSNHDDVNTWNKVKQVSIQSRTWKAVYLRCIA